MKNNEDNKNITDNDNKELQLVSPDFINTIKSVAEEERALRERELSLREKQLTADSILELEVARACQEDKRHEHEFRMAKLNTEIDAEKSKRRDEIIFVILILIFSCIFLFLGYEQLAYYIIVAVFSGGMGIAYGRSQIKKTPTHT